MKALKYLFYALFVFVSFLAACDGGDKGKEDNGSQEENDVIIIDDQDTARFAIIIDDQDTARFEVVVDEEEPKKAHIIIDDQDTALVEVNTGSQVPVAQYMDSIEQKYESGDTEH